MHFMNNSKIIDELGGTSAVAKLCEVKPSSVSEWRINGIPNARRQYLALLRPDVFGASADSESNPVTAAGGAPLGSRQLDCHPCVEEAA